MKLVNLFLVLFLSCALANADESHEDHAHESEQMGHKEGSHNHDSHDSHEDHDEDEDKHKEKGHDHDHESDDKNHSDDSHDHSSNTDDHGKHAEHEEENGAIGAGKGILEKGENGFRLADEAIENFGLKYFRVDTNRFNIDASAVVKVLDKKYLFRQRDGWFKKIPVDILSKSKSKYSVSLQGIMPQDKIVIAGVGFLRTAELVVEEGVAHGHSH